MRIQLRSLLVAALVLAGATACGSSDSNHDADTKGQRTQAVQELHRYGLTTAQAECMADKIGPDVVVAAPDMATLATGQPYQDAAKDCLDGS